jgi:hypothetical protein
MAGAGVVIDTPHLLQDEHVARIVARARAAIRAS